jgi:hypothetical protein
MRKGRIATTLFFYHAYKVDEGILVETNALVKLF